MVLTRRGVHGVLRETSKRGPGQDGIKNDGTSGSRVKIVYDTGAYAEKGPTVCEQASTGAIGPTAFQLKVDAIASIR